MLNTKYGNITNKQHYKNAILVPGGGLDQKGAPNPWVLKRLDKVLSIANKEDLVILLSRYTVHKPPVIDGNGMPISECMASAKYLIGKGLPIKDIRTEDISYDTIGNFFFARLLFINPLDIENIIIINSEFHMPRTQVIANWIFNLGRTKSINLKYIKTPNTGLSKTTLSKRIKQERDKIIEFQKLKSHINTEEDLHRWIFTEHEAYSAKGVPHRCREKLILASY